MTLVAETFLPHINGVSGSVVRAARYLHSLGHLVSIVAPDPAPLTLDNAIPVHPVRSFRVPGMAVDVGYPTTPSLVKLLSTLQPDVVHLASPLILGYQAMRAAHHLDIPTVAVFQTDIAGFARHYKLTPLSALSDKFIGRIHAEATLTLAPSQAYATYLADQGVTAVQRWGRGVDLQQFHPRWRSPELRTRWLRGNPQRVLVGYVGRLAPEKSVQSLACVATDPRIQLVIVGDGPSRGELEKVLPRAHFTGLLTGADLGSAMASLDIVVAPGERETFCQVIQEAMAAGVPVVAPNVGGPADLVEHGETGLLYPAGNVNELRRCIDALVENPAARAVMNSQARHAVKDRTWTFVSDELVEHYRNVLRSGRRKAVA